MTTRQGTLPRVDVSYWWLQRRPLRFLFRRQPRRTTLLASTSLFPTRHPLPGPRSRQPMPALGVCTLTATNPAGAAAALIGSAERTDSPLVGVIAGCSVSSLRPRGPPGSGCPPCGEEEAQGDFLPAGGARIRFSPSPFATASNVRQRARVWSTCGSRPSPRETEGLGARSGGMWSGTRLASCRAWGTVHCVAPPCGSAFATVAAKLPRLLRTC